MKGNLALNKARFRRDTDEWFTPFELIEEELTFYPKVQFKDKVVYCPCDDENSNFFNYFKLNFDILCLKKLVCSSFNFNEGFGKLVEVTSPSNISVNFLSNDGDFRKQIKLFKESDVVVTNPPFSMFRELFSVIMSCNNKFLLIGNLNMLLYKQIFPYLMRNEIWLGHRFGDMHFKVPSETKKRSTRYWEDKLSQKWRSIGNALWLTNLILDYEKQSLKMTKLYNCIDYPKFDDFEAINVSKTANIPRDYFGIMAVPLTYIKYHDSRLFKLIGCANHGCGEFDLFCPILNGKHLYKKLLIQRQ